MTFENLCLQEHSVEAPSAGDERERRQLQAGDTAAAGGVGANPARPPRAHPRPATRRRNHKHQTFRSLLLSRLFYQVES